MSTALLILTFVSTLGAGLGAGVFFAFDSFVFPGLRRLPAPRGIAAMQSINVTAINPVFMIQLIGTAVLCGVLVVLALVNLGQPYALWLLLGGFAYLAGPLATTRAFHVPRNDALVALDPDSAEAAAYWARYQREWAAGNVVRTVLATAATALLIVAMQAG